MIELRWINDQFDTIEELSEHAVLVRDPKGGPGSYIPLILQYREDCSHPDYSHPWITVEYANPKDKP